MRNKKLNQILILLVLLVIIGVANYFNYYRISFKHWPTTPEYSFEDLSEEEQEKMIEASTNIKNIEPKESAENQKPEKKQVDSNADNYLIYAVDSSGKLVRWKKTKIKVYVENSQYRDALYDALSEYNKVFEGFFTFVLSSASNADIKIQIVDRFDSNENNKELYMAGVTNNIFDGKNDLSSSTIQLLSVKPNTKKRVTKFEIYTVLMHELGHALGVIGHSPNEKDVMYAFTAKSRGVLTYRDINTIKMLYSNDEELIQSQTRGFASKKIDEAKKYVKKTPKKALSWINLAKTYYDNGKKAEALEAYKEALTLEPNNPDIYQSMAECYYSSEKYESAIKYSNIAIEKTKDPQVLAQLNNTIGVSYAKLSNEESAFKHFEYAFGYSPNSKMYLHNLLTMCISLDKKQEAIKYINIYKSSGGDIAGDEIVQKVMKWAN